MVGCGVGPDVGAASVHIRSQSIINGYGTGTTATGRNYRRSTCARLPRSSWRLGWAASRSAARGGAASGAGRDWAADNPRAGSGGPLCTCKERSGEASHTTKSVLDAPRRVARTGRRISRPSLERLGTRASAHASDRWIETRGSPGARIRRREATVCQIAARRGDFETHQRQRAAAPVACPRSPGRRHEDEEPTPAPGCGGRRSQEQEWAPHLHAFARASVDRRLGRQLFGAGGFQNLPDAQLFGKLWPPFDVCALRGCPASQSSGRRRARWPECRGVPSSAG